MSITILIPFYLFEPTFVSIHKKNHVLIYLPVKKITKKDLWKLMII